ncbi:hypothetical protein [Enterobacter sp. SA187]|uniref:hypothetical protein n=1 Tax=Enterobacter sp. SA187 TaxID=1914861 RepID=UPI0009329F4B|nr:hypothetical protein [Enterobacter sp. SA187]
MGFPSPAADYIETTMCADIICNLTANSLVIETSTGAAVVDRGLIARQGDVLFASLDGRTYFGKFMGKAFITHDGDPIEGECLNELQVIGVVTHFVVDTQNGVDDECPVI